MLARYCRSLSNPCTLLCITKTKENAVLQILEKDMIIYVYCAVICNIYNECCRSLKACLSALGVHGCSSQPSLCLAAPAAPTRQDDHESLPSTRRAQQRWNSKRHFPNQLYEAIYPALNDFFYFAIRRCVCVPQAPTVAVEDMTISAASIRSGLPATDRLALPLLQLQQESAEVSGRCVLVDEYGELMIVSEPFLYPS